jgi:hypothetical protein
MNDRVRLEQAKQGARLNMLKLLEKNIETMKETLEEVADDCLHDAGFRCDFDDDTSGAMDEWLEMQTQLIEEAVRYWHASELGEIWAMLSYDPDNGTRGLEVEFFRDCPATYKDVENWPRWFRVYEGNIDGGDSIVSDARGANFG